MRDIRRKSKREASLQERDGACQEKTGCNEQIQLRKETAAIRNYRENISIESRSTSHRPGTGPKLKIKFDFAFSREDNNSSKKEGKRAKLFETNARHLYGIETLANKRKQRKRVLIPLRNRLLKNLTIRRGWKEKITCCPKYCWARCRTLPIEKCCILRYRLQNAVLTQPVGHALETHRSGEI